MAIGAEEATLKLSVETNAAEAALDKFAQKAARAGSSIQKELGGALDILEGKWGPQAELATRFFTIVSEGVEKFIAFAERGDRVSDVMGALSTNLEEATRRTSGMIGEMELAIAANAATEAGLRLSGEQFASVAVAAKRYADATGTDAPAAMDRLVNAIVRGSARGLKPFGLHATDTAGAIKELTERLGSATVAAEGFSDKLDATRNHWAKFVDGIAVEVDTQSGTGLFGMFLDGLTQITGGMDHLGASIVWVGRSMLTIGNPLGAFVDAADKWLRVLEDPIMRTLYGRTRGQVEAAAFMDSEDRTPGSETTAPLGLRYSSAPRERPSTRRAEPARRGGGGSAPVRPGSNVFSLGQANEQRIAALRAQEEENATNAIMAQRQREIDTDHALISVEREMYEASNLRIQAERSVLEEEWRINDEETRIAEERVARQRQMLASVQEYAQMGGQALGVYFARTASLEEASIQRDANARLAKTEDGDERAKIEEQTQAKLLKVRQAAEVRQLLITAAVEAVASAVSFASLNVPQGIMHASAAALALATAASLGGSSHSVGSGRYTGGHTAGSLRGGVGGADGGGNVTNITVMLDAAGGVIQDSQLRRLGKYVSDAHSRGYINGRRAA